ncbi:MAG: TRAP transporter large permease [Brevinema sp.]
MDTTALATLVLFGSFFIFLALGVPISVGIGLCSIITALCLGPLDIVLFPLTQKLFGGLDSFTFLAIPFFILSGNIMNKGGIAIRLVNFAKLLGGRLPGSLAQTNIIGNMLFGAISGSSIAAAAAIGGIMGPLQEKEGYNRAFSAAVNTCSAPTGILIPPSGPLILYSLVSGGTSIAALFVAGYIPGMLMGLSIMIVASVYAYKLKYAVYAGTSFTEAVKIILNAIPSLSLIVVVIGGIILGVFTATEGAAIAVAYSLLLSLFYRELNWSMLVEVFGKSLQGSAMVLFLIATSGMMAWVMAYAGIPQFVANSLLAVSSNKYIILLIMNFCLLIIGTFMDLTPAVLIFTPIFLPIATSLGMHPIHFGIMLIFNLGIGNMTPPVGSVLFVACSVGKVKMQEMVPFLWPFFIAIIGALLMVTYIPEISLFLPKMFNLIK